MWGLFWRYNGLVIPRYSSPSASLPSHPLPPHPPYNPRFIVYFMTMTPSRHLWAPFFRSPMVYFLFYSPCILLPLLHHDAQDIDSLLAPTLPVVQAILTPSLTFLYNSHGRIILTSFHHGGIHIIHLFIFSELLTWIGLEPFWREFVLHVLCVDRLGTGGVAGKYGCLFI